MDGGRYNSRLLSRVVCPAQGLGKHRQKQLSPSHLFLNERCSLLASSTEGVGDSTGPVARPPSREPPRKSSHRGPSANPSAPESRRPPTHRSSVVLGEMLLKRSGSTISLSDSPASHSESQKRLLSHFPSPRLTLYQSEIYPVCYF